MTSALRLNMSGQSITTRLFGTLDITADDILHFADGLPGFPDAQRFLLLTTPAPALRWLQSVDQPALAFLLVEYDRVAESLGTAPGAAHAIVTLPSADQPATVNLRAPVLLDLGARTGAQIILTESDRGTAEGLDLDALTQESTPRHS